MRESQLGRRKRVTAGEENLRRKVAKEISSNKGNKCTKGSKISIVRWARISKEDLQRRHSHVSMHYFLHNLSYKTL